MTEHVSGSGNVMELNNLAIRDLPQVLKKETLMEGHWSLVEDAQANCQRLHDAGIPLDELNKLIVAADLMRKPGIKATKVRLFTAMGIRSLKHLGEQNPQSFRSQLEDFIGRTGIVKAIPTPKEVMSDVSWARLYPVVVE